MLNILKKLINPDEILKIQNCQYSEYIMIEDTIPASTQKMCSVNVSSLGDFMCIQITGHYTTLVLDGQQAIIDNGVNSLRGKLLDGSCNRPLFNDYIPLDLFLSPGRIKSGLSTTFQTDPSSNNLFYPIRFEYSFPINSQILFDVKNDSDTPNSFAILFHGVRFPARQRKQ